MLERIRSFAEHAPAAVFVKDAAGRYVFVNRWFRELLGIGRDEVLGRTVVGGAAGPRSRAGPRSTTGGWRLAARSRARTPSRPLAASACS